MAGLATFEEMTGGSARYLSGLRDALRSLGHDVEVRTASAAVGSPGYVEVGIRGQAARTLRRVLVVIPGSAVRTLRWRPDVVNTHFALDGLGPTIAAGIRGVPVVVNFQGPWAQEALASGRRGRWPVSTRSRHVIESFVYRRASACIVLSAAFRDLLVAEYGVDRTRVHVIPAGIDLAPFALDVAPAVARQRLGLDDVPTVVSVRRLVPRMGLDLALEAVASLPASRVTRYLVAGTGPERQRLERLAVDLGVQQRVRFLGRVSDADLPWLYAAADASLVPTRALEGFGYVALESMAAGTPVVATRSGGLVDVVGGLEAEWLADPTPAAIAGALERALGAADPDAQRARCRAYASEFRWEAVAPRIVDVFRAAIASARR